MPKDKRIAVILAVLAVPVIILSGLLYRNYTVPILMYHSVYPGAVYANRLSVSTLTFERQMRFLSQHRYNILPLEAVADIIRDGKRPPDKTVAVTFDDGYKDNYSHAFPILKKYRIPATVFVIIDEIGRPDRLSWEEIREMQDSGLVFFASHCLGPEPLVNIQSREEIKRQISESRRVLEEKLGRRVAGFSYPEGRFNPEIRQMVIDAGYGFAVATNPGRDFPDGDVYALKRLRISENAGNLFVFWVESSGFYNFLREYRHK